MSRWRKSAVVFFYTILTLVAGAHEISNIFIKLDRDGDSGWRGSIHFDAGYALPAMREDKAARQPKRDWLLKQSPEQWRELREGAEAYLRECLAFRKKGDESGLVWRVEFPDFNQATPDFPRMLDGGAYFRVLIKGEVPTGVLELAVNDGDRPSFTVSVAGVDELSVVLPGSQLDLMRKMKRSDDEAIEMSKESWWSRAEGFFKLGYIHVLPLGLDHVLFILALFFLSAKWRPLLSQSLMFTLAHTVTLALAIGGVVYVSPRWVEPLIALSLVCVAVENLWTKKTGPRRLASVFLFGLVHGLGFAGALSESLQGQTDWLMPLIAMNIGVEMAQVSILLTCLVVFTWFADKNWYELLRRSASVIICLIGMWWFVSRLIN